VGALEGRFLAEPKNNATIEIKKKDHPDLTIELAEYLEILGSTIRLDILRLIQSKPMDVQYISDCLDDKMQITSSRQNTETHIDKLLKIGLVAKRPGEREGRAVMQYAVVPGSIEAAIRTLNKVLKMNLTFELKSQVQKTKEKLKDEFSQKVATLRVLGGVDDGRVFPLNKNEVNIGRIDYEKRDKINLENDVVLSNSYGAVSRVTKPHARMLFENGQWYIIHCEGVNGTYLWERKLSNGHKEALKDGDIIALAEGAKSARLLFELPKAKT
jgi:DNA-binding transcriptional ArsR family regulator